MLRKLWSWERQQTAIYRALSGPLHISGNFTLQMLRITFVMDRGYIDFQRLFVFTLCSAFFVVRTKENVLLSTVILTGWTRPLACVRIIPSS